MRFHYRAIDERQRALSGQIEAAGPREAARLLRAQGLRPLSIERQPPAKGSVSRRKSSIRERILLIQELATLLRAGIPLAEAVGTLAGTRNGTDLGDELLEMEKGLRQGMPFSQTLERSRLSFPPYLYHLVSAGELTGDMAGALEKATEQMEYEEEMRQESRNALIYPAVLVTTGIAATLVVFVVVVPRFAKLMEHGAELPALSRWVIGTGLFFNEHLALLALGAAALTTGVIMGIRSQTARQHFFDLLLRFPVIGNWLLETELGRWSSLLSTLLASRVPLVEALELARDLLRPPVLRDRMEHVLKQVKAGRRLSEALENVQALDPTGLNLVRVGEHSGNLASMLGTLATLRETAGRRRMKRFLQLLEPAAILLIGGVIGLIMTAIMLAITSINNVQF